MTTSGCYDNSNLDKTRLIWNFLLLLKVESYDNRCSNKRSALLDPSLNSFNFVLFALDLSVIYY